MLIEDIIEEMIKDYPEGNRTRMDAEIFVDSKPFKLTAYKIKNQNLIRIDIRQMEKADKNEQKL